MCSKACWLLIEDMRSGERWTGTNIAMDLSTQQHQQVIKNRYTVDLECNASISLAQVLTRVYSIKTMFACMPCAKHCGHDIKY